MRQRDDRGHTWYPYGGNPLASAVAGKVLDLINRQRCLMALNSVTTGLLSVLIH